MNAVRYGFFKSMCLILCLCLVCGCAACARTEYEAYELLPNEYLMTEDGSVYTPDGSTAQLTQADIQAMNGGGAYMVFGNEGYLSFLDGRYYENKIADYEDAVASIQGVAELLGLGAGCEFFAKYGETDNDGYTYYTFHQRYGDATVQFATLRVAVDPQGYAAGLACSFTPNIGIAEKTDAITPEQAVEAVKARFPNETLTYYPEATKQVAVTSNYVVQNAYAVYTSNPYMTSSFDMAYYEHFISLDGTFLYCLPVATMATENSNPYTADEYFSGLQPARYTGEALLYDGSIMPLDIPIAYNPSDGLYYLCDLERKIMVADYSSFCFESSLNFVTSNDGKSWQNNHLITYANYIRAYDFYAGLGLDSVDDFGTPILVLINYCDQNGVPVANACHLGMFDGWVCFASSDGYPYSEALDIIAHEYTHGVTCYSMGDNVYQNETGAINESYSDIMGNICEMTAGATTDRTWLIGENCGNVFRSMSSPNLYRQPSSKSDSYYMPPTDNPGNEPGNNNDLGGVHINSSLLNSVAYKLWAAGMPLNEEASLWLKSMELITPWSGYKEVYGALLMSVDINGFDAGYKELITDAFNSAELLN